MTSETKVNLVRFSFPMAKGSQQSGRKPLLLSDHLAGFGILPNSDSSSVTHFVHFGFYFGLPNSPKKLLSKKKKPCFAPFILYIFCLLFFIVTFSENFPELSHNIHFYGPYINGHLLLCLFFALLILLIHLYLLIKHKQR